jgi:hypothetical protein
MDPHYGQPCKIIMDPGPLQYAGYAQICAGLFFLGGGGISPLMDPMHMYIESQLLMRSSQKATAAFFP